MKQTNLFYKTRKEIPSDADSINASYLVRAGFIEKHMSGVYSILPLGLRVIQKIENIVREEMNNVGGQEILMNVLQPKELLDKTGRWEEMDNILYKTIEGNSQLCLGATHEEQITTIVKNYINSYKSLPTSLYQIQTKFRKEARAKSGLLRGREFIMKDMYSFHKDNDDFEKYYDLCKKAYLKLFKRIGLEAKVVEADGGVFTDKYSHEFQALTVVGEDTIFYCDKCDFAQNKEICQVKAGDKCPNCDNGIIQSEKGIEIGNIFPLETKFSKQIGATFTDADGKINDMIMGCYGIGITRSMATVVEIYFDATNNKMNWPKEIAPYRVHLISIQQNEEAEKIYNDLKSKGIEVLYDDRDISAGTKFAEADLIGCPERIVISKRTLENNSVEYTQNNSTEKILLSGIMDRI